MKKTLIQIREEEEEEKLIRNIPKLPPVIVLNEDWIPRKLITKIKQAIKKLKNF